jgi:hypothetical protein
MGDLAAGPSCGFTDFVDEGDEGSYSAIYMRMEIGCLEENG